jgi:hypothetical protein
LTLLLLPVTVVLVLLLLIVDAMWRSPTLAAAPSSSPRTPGRGTNNQAPRRVD